ncbi:hypothetical protein [Frankia sp. Cr2]|uniref:hypothetical protein n=1 Tax=Frankia sp. Cr2 TaxID=3073932 RepID=UPI002AD4B2D4|nr:hypothetical protein [Frankia sp. Cr2]
MSDESVSYPDDASAATFLLTVRGRMAAVAVEETRKVHNETAGAAPSVAAARSLGDLSHNVYAGYGEDHRGELLFIDFWNSLSGLGQFFSDPQVQAGGNMLFASRENPVWAPAENAGSYHLAVPSGRTPTGVGLLRAEVTSLDKAASAFRDYASATINRSRLHGMVSHSVWTRVPDPGAPAVPEVIGVDVWLDADEMARYYDLSLGFEHLGPIFVGKPDTSIWQAAPGDWTEW